MMELRILGSLEARLDGRQLDLGGPRQRTVLAVLLLAADRVVPTDTLIEAVWNGRPPVTGRTQVAICVAGLRKAFRAAGCHDDLIVTAHRGYVLRAAGHRIDLRDFESLVAQGRRAARDGQVVKAADLLGDALGLWRGPALAGISSQVVETQAAQLEESRLLAAEEHVALRLELGQHRSLLGELATLVGENPLREQARAHLILAQYRSGRRAEALAAFREGRRLSTEELGLEPGQALQALHAAILRDDPALRPPSAAAASVAPAQLPANVPAFTGRDEELSVLDGLLRDRSPGGPPPIGFVTGGSGVGKTSLAVHWAHRVAGGFADGQLYADLRGYDPAREPLGASAVLDQFLRALGVPGDQIPALGSRRSLYCSLLSDRQVLVVLDNVETFAQVEPLLPGNGTCCVLVTGRDQLGELVGGHGAVRLRLAGLEHDQATRLFGRLLGDARVAEEPSSVARLAELCDGLPLALRIAASRLATKPHWTIGELVGRLEDPRRRLDELSFGEREVRARLDGSYRRLGADAARLYRRLGALNVPSFATWIGAALLDAPLAEAERLLEQLVDAQLLEILGRDGTGGVRYRLRDLVRLHAWERALAEETELPEGMPAGASPRTGRALADPAPSRGATQLTHAGAARQPEGRDHAW